MQRESDREGEKLKGREREKAGRERVTVNEGERERGVEDENVNSKLLRQMWAYRLSFLFLPCFPPYFHSCI